MRRHGQPGRLRCLQSEAEELSFLFSIAKENFTENLKKKKK